MIQIDMYMPDSCCECWFCKFDSNTGSTECVIGENILARYFESLNFEGRHEECPLIDVPDIHFGNIPEFSNSSTDCISRQAAIDAITVRADRCAENFSTDDPFWEGLVIAKSIVKSLPLVQAATPVRPERKENDWNLCSDRLPEKEGRYLITVDEDGRKDVSDDFFYIRNDGTPSWHYEINVIAWMPLPEPWEGEQE